jgi:hypothetical protein
MLPALASAGEFVPGVFAVCGVSNIDCDNGRGHRAKPPFRKHRSTELTQNSRLSDLSLCFQSFKVVEAAGVEPASEIVVS